MKHRLFSVVLLSAVLSALPALALDLHAARASGAVGEKLDGYVAAIQNSPDVSALVADVNAKRHEEYARIAKEKHQSESDVAKIAAQQVIQSLPAGSMYQTPNGSWKKK